MGESAAAAQQPRPDGEEIIVAQAEVDAESAGAAEVKKPAPPAKPGGAQPDTKWQE
jgi:hypothetical protein